MVEKFSSQPLKHIFFAAFVTIVILCSLLLGDIWIPLKEFFEILIDGPFPGREETFRHAAVWQLRMPRMLAAFLTGAILAICGMACHFVIQNPLADPYTLGISSGAAFGTACAAVAMLPWAATVSFAGGICSFVIVWSIGETRAAFDTRESILGGGRFSFAINGMGLGYV